MTTFQPQHAPPDTPQGAFLQTLDQRLQALRVRLGRSSPPPTNSQSENPQERRRSVRHRYARVQSVAPCRQHAPGKIQFEDMECRDLSKSGFSFYATERPDYQQVIAALGNAPNLLFLTARVRRVSEVKDATGSRYLVGCEFIDKISV